MDFTAKAAWIYKDNMPDATKLGRYGIRTVYVDPTSANATQAVMSLRTAGVTPGAYFASSWQPGMTGAQFAEWLSPILNHLLPRARFSLEAPPCMLDIEATPTAWTAACISRYRQFQPARPTAFTCEPFQGGATPWATLRTANMHVYPQLYYGDMSPADPAAVMLEAARYYPAQMLHPLYDGARYGSDQRDGCYFTLERMP